jgi:RND superfamily putative drug exporter
MKSPGLSAGYSGWDPSGFHRIEVHSSPGREIPRPARREKSPWLSRLGDFCARRAGWVLTGWAVVLVAAAAGARQLPALLSGGSGDIPASASLRADGLLRTEFANPYTQMLVLAIRSPSLERDPAFRARMFRTLQARWSASPMVAAVMTEENLADQRLLPQPGTGHVAFIGLKAANVREAEQAIPVLRAASESILRAAQRRHPDLEWALTGRAALTYDMNRFNADDTTRAEARVLPLTLVVLILAFGSLVAAGAPLLLGLTSTTVTLGIVCLLARFTIFSNLVQNVASMVGLAVGIDYSLFLIHRYREELRRAAGAHPDEHPALLRRRALAEAMAKAGSAVFFSGLAVLIGMGGLLFTPLMETRSVGLGGCLVVAVAVCASLTLLPALITLLGSRLEWPRVLSRRLNSDGARRRWGAWAGAVMRFPVLGAAVSLAVLVVLAWPGRYTRFGFPEENVLPRELEFMRGMKLLQGMGLAGLLAPVDVILTDTQGGPAFTRERLADLQTFSARLRADARVATVQGPVDLADDWPAARYQILYADVDAALASMPAVRDMFISKDRQRLLLQVVLKPDTSLEEAKALARAIPAWMTIPGLRVDLGGRAVYYNDFDAAMKQAYGRCVGFVLVVTTLVLLLIFRAPVVAVKALLLNLLSVLAGYGATVFVFQLGHGAHWFGVAAPIGVIPLTIPLLIFCILFGLSMDYEVFLLSRAREGFQRTGNSAEGVREALAETGPVITSAALIMVAVFGAFAFARVVIVQMLGLGLAVAVLVDATVIRILLAPALMRVAGRWNWWPVTPARPQPLTGAPGDHDASAKRLVIARSAAADRGDPAGLLRPPVRRDSSQ